MIELERHIEILLLSNDCVIIPDFGGFMAHYVNARYDETEYIFLPPQRTIGFNPQLTLNDSLLAQSYIEAYDISYPEALQRIENEVRDLRQYIEDKGSYEFFDLGTIYLNDCGKYEFEPCEAGILTPELYGLNSFVMKPFERLSNVQHSDIQNERNEALGDVDNKEHVIRLSTLRNIAVACIAVVAFFFITSPIGNSEMKVNEARINTDMLTRIFPHCKNIESPVTKIKKIDTCTTKEKPTLPNVKTSIKIEDSSFYTIVLCSRVSINNAKLFVNQLHTKGLTNACVWPHGRYIRVITGQYTTEKTAVEEAKLIQQDYGISDCWITKISER